MRIKLLLVFLAAGLLATSSAHAGERKLTHKQLAKQVKIKTATELSKYTTSKAMQGAARDGLIKLQKNGTISEKQLSALKAVATSKDERAAKTNLKAAQALAPDGRSVYGIMVASLIERLAQASEGTNGEPFASVSDDFKTILAGAAFGATLGGVLGGPGGALVGAVAGAMAGAVAVGEDIGNGAGVGGEGGGGEGGEGGEGGGGGGGGEGGEGGGGEGGE